MDVLFIVVAIVLSLFVSSYVYDSGVVSQIADDEDTLRILKEQDATLKEQISEANTAHYLDQEEHAIPHPRLEDRDSQVIGDHTTVSWEYSDRNSGKYLTYELQLIKLTSDGSCLPGDFLECIDHEKRFLATDGSTQTSRIPPDDHLSPGTYVWRVAAVPIGTAIQNQPETDDLNHLSEWSSFGAFTIYSSLADRIIKTGRVRVGVNLEQNTLFSKRDNEGNVIGFDISLIYAIVEGCMSRSVVSSTISYDDQQCQKFIERHPPPTTEHPPCTSTSNDSRICVELVPVRKWGAWQPALQRKEIDLFIGGVTAAEAREGNGVHFTRGYLPYHTRIYVRRADLPFSSLTLINWLAKPRKIGIIENSSNQELLNDILASKSLAPYKDKLQSQPFASYPSMEDAMDRGEVDGILVDETFVDHPDWEHLDRLEDITDGWTKYVHDFLGNRKQEAISIAIATDEKNSLFTAIDNALKKDSPISRQYIPVLCTFFWPPDGTASFKCPEQE